MEDDQYARILVGGATIPEYPPSTWDPISGRPVRQIEVNIVQNFTDNHFQQLNPYVSRIQGFQVFNRELFQRADLYSVKSHTWNPATATMTMPDNHFGNVGHLDIRKQDYAIKAIKLGFDFDFNPIAFIADDDTSVLGTTNFAQYARVNGSSPGIFAMDCLNVKTHSPLRYEHGKLVADPMLVDGISMWILKVDRVEGLEVRLKGLEWAGKETGK